MSHRAVFIAAIAFAALFVRTAAAQCPPQWFEGGWTLGFNGPAYATALWDPDGPGPLPPLLVAAGDFHIAGGIPAERIAAWDGTTWRALGTGLDGYVNALTVHNGRLIAGGDFSTAGGVPAAYVAAWDGSAWRALGEGLDIEVRALTVFQGDLIAGRAWAGSAVPIMRWDGTGWQVIGSGFHGSVYALTEFGGALVAGGSFSLSGSHEGILRWDGAAWASINSSYALPRCFAQVGGQLYVGCSVFGESGATVQRWNGSTWDQLGDTLWSSASQWVEVFALSSYHGDLIAAGAFQPVNGPYGFGLARWTGSGWRTHAGGLDSGYDIPYTMAEFQGELWVGGYFSFPGGHAINSLARWNGSAWRSSPPAPIVNAEGQARTAVAFNNELIVGGRFRLTTPEGTSDGLARWDGAAWHPMPGATASLGSMPPGSIISLVVYRGQLLALGTFRIAGSFVFMAQWTGSAWQPFSAQGTPETLLVIGDDLFASGHFYNKGSYFYAARWTGTAWQPMPGLPYWGVMTSYNGRPAAAGYGSGSGFVSVWDGALWHSIGYPNQIGVKSLVEYDGRLVVAGDFTTIGGVPVARVAAWDGQVWTAMGGFPGQYGSMTGLLVHDGELYAGGYVGRAVLARWRPLSGQWQTLPNFTADRSTIPIASFGGQLLVGGPFPEIAGLRSPGLARWGLGSAPCYPNCDCSDTPPYLNTADFLCFLTRFRASDPYSNCDGSTTPPVLNVSDFLCFLNRFATGCP